MLLFISGLIVGALFMFFVWMFCVIAATSNGD